VKDLSNTKLKVFHGLVNYGTQAGFLAKALRQLGIYSKSYTGPDIYERETDYHFRQRKSIFSKLFFYKIVYPLIKISCLFRYNVFHFYYGTSLLPFHFDLPLIKFFGKKIVHHYLGHDVELYQETKDKYEFSNMDCWADDTKGVIHDKHVKKRLANELKYSDFQVVCAPQYSPFVPGATFIPLAIDVNKIKFHPLSEKNYEVDPVLILHAPTHRGVKGTKFLIEAVDRLKQEGILVELKICENITHSQLLEEYQRADFSVVSLLGGWYGTAGIEVMATGRGVVAFLRDEYFQYVGEEFKDDLPVVNADKDTIYQTLKEILSKNNFQEWGLESRQFVEKYHDMGKVAKKFLQIYESI
jgi:glycosyltransferase involved in cell wall biosynthesis